MYETSFIIFVVCFDVVICRCRFLLGERLHCLFKWNDGYCIFNVSGVNMSEELKPLKKIINKCWHFVDGVKIDGVHGEIYGDASGIRGDVTGITGNVSQMRGHMWGLTGDVTGIQGDVTDIIGNFDNIPLSERSAKPNVTDWIE